MKVVFNVLYFLRAIQCVGHSFPYVAHFIFLRYVWIRTLRAAAASRRATNIATHLPRHMNGKLPGDREVRGAGGGEV